MQRKSRFLINYHSISFHFTYQSRNRENESVKANENRQTTAKKQNAHIETTNVDRLSANGFGRSENLIKIKLDKPRHTLLINNTQ